MHVTMPAARDDDGMRLAGTQTGVFNITARFARSVLDDARLHGGSKAD